MRVKTKIFVLHKKEILFTAAIILLALVLLLIILLSFHPKAAAPAMVTQTASLYVPGVYAASVELGDSSLEVQVTLDADHINDIALIDKDKIIETMYPLMNDAMDELSSQILENQSFEDLTVSSTNRYSAQLLYKAILSAIEKGKKQL